MIVVKVNIFVSSIEYIISRSEKKDFYPWIIINLQSDNIEEKSVWNKFFFLKQLEFTYYILSKSTSDIFILFSYFWWAFVKYHYYQYKIVWMGGPSSDSWI